MTVLDYTHLVNNKQFDCQQYTMNFGEEITQKTNVNKHILY